MYVIDIMYKQMYANTSIPDPVLPSIAITAGGVAGIDIILLVFIAIYMHMY